MSNFRSPQLLKLARECPHCMCCGILNQGQVVGAHWRSLDYGAGTGIKPHDLVAYVCNACHDWIDQRKTGIEKWERERMFHRAFYQTMLWLLQEGHLTVHLKPARTA